MSHWLEVLEDALQTNQTLCCLISCIVQQGRIITNLLVLWIITNSKGSVNTPTKVWSLYSYMVFKNQLLVQVVMQNKLRQCEKTRTKPFRIQVSHREQYRGMCKNVYYFFLNSHSVCIVCLYLIKQQCFLSAGIRRFTVYRSTEFPYNRLTVFMHHKCSFTHRHTYTHARTYTYRHKHVKTNS